MQSFTIGISAMSASERALSLVGQNIANANTPGYHRQALNLAPRVLGGTVGSGVDIQGITRVRDGMIENSLIVGQSQNSRLDAELPVYRQLESLFSPGEGSLIDQTQNLFNQIQRLAQTPDDPAQRSAVVNTASIVAGELNHLGQELGQLRDGLRTRAEDGLNQINTLATRVADYNKQIQVLQRMGQSTAELSDLRDQTISQISELADVRVIEQAFGVSNVLVGNVPLVVGGTTSRLASTTNSTGLYVVVDGTTTPANLTGGKVGGWLAAHNDILNEYQPRLDTFARELATRLDSIQATGLPLGGPQKSALGVRSVSSATDPLADVSALPVQAGSLFLSVTDQATGNRTLTEIAFDPTTQSLQDLASAITTASGGQVQGSVTSNNRLQVEAQAGYSFDFAGRTPSSPTNLAMNGSAAPRVSGIYSGTDNGAYTVQVVGSGTVGTTSNLTLQVRDAKNDVVASYNIGEGYAPDTILDIGNGLKVSIGAGTTSSGSFTIPVVAQADTTGALAALGVNTLFAGADASTLAVRSDILSDPSRLAGSRDGQPGDASNLLRMAALDTQKVLNNGTQTLSDALGGLAADVGTDVLTRSDQQTALNTLQQNMKVLQQSVSGIDPNEELTKMLQFQRSFQMSAKFIATVNVTLDSLLEIVG